MIVGYIHVCQKGDWKKSFTRICAALKRSGLYDRAAEIRLGVVSDSGTLAADDSLNDPKFRVVVVDRAAEYERPTLRHMRKMAEYDPEKTLYFYLHTKGISHFGTERELNVLDWIDLMLYWNVENWQLAIEKLQTYATYGCNDTGLHYSGNFWWATKQHILKLPTQIGAHYVAPENWVQTVNDNKYNVYSSGLQGFGHYAHRFPRQKYANDVSAQAIPPPAPKISDRVDVLKQLIDAVSANSYLELGVDSEYSFKRVPIADKTGVDPNKKSKATLFVTSDEFFAGNTKKFDVIFIDGDHSAKQVKKDILNALDSLSANGVIVCHDMLPTTFEMQLTPQTQRVYTGDGWRTWVELRQTRADLKMFVVDVDYGCGVICRGEQTTLNIDMPTTFENFCAHKNQWMNIVSVKDFLTLIRDFAKCA